MKEYNNIDGFTRQDKPYPGSLEDNAVYWKYYLQEIRMGVDYAEAERNARMYLFLNISEEMKRLNSKKAKKLSRCAMYVLAVLAAVILILPDARSQSFRNTGTYNGQGTFRVKEQATGLPDTVSGTFEYFGGNQQVESRNFENLLLTGSGSTKQTTAGALGILRTVAVADGVRFQVASSMDLETANGRITQEDGLIVGRVTKTVDMISPSDSTDFGGMGLILRSQGNALGSTNAVRISGASGVVNHGSSNSIRRLYRIQPQYTAGLAGNLNFRYASDELSGSDSSTLDLWRSEDGTTWRRQHTLRNGNVLARSGRFLAGSWTAADSSNLLGRANYEFDPDSILAASSDSLHGRVNAQLDSLFIAQVTDVYGNPIQNAQVQFQITETPTGSTGENLSVISALTDFSGTASTRLKLGSKIGRYGVSASVVSVPSARIDFYGYASSGINRFNMMPAPVQDSIKQIVGPFIVEAVDEFNGIIAGSGVNFTVIPPVNSGATKQTIFTADTTTNISGRAQAMVQLGEKVGIYTVEVRSTENDTVLARFYVRATHGIPALAWIRSATEYTDTVGHTLPSFVYAITDSDTNSVGGRNLLFTVVSRPDSASGDSLVNVVSVTDSTGAGSAALRLGNKAGDYMVSAEDPGVPNSARYFVGKAIPGSAGILAYSSGANQSKRILTVLDNEFVARITDIFGNPVAGIPVQFAITGTPAGAWGQMLTKAEDTTDSFGNARTYLKLGSRTGNYIVTASTPIITAAGVSFNATALVGTANRIEQQSGNIQVGQIGDLLTPFVVEVSDTGGNLVPNARVSFTISEHPAYTVMDSLIQPLAFTDTLGHASSALLLGSRQGRYQVRAIIDNGKDTVFTAYAIMLIADANHDKFRNIGDLTSIIDHVIGRRLLTGYDFARADMYPVRQDGSIGDGIVDIRDAQVCRDSLLAAGWDPTRDWMLTPSLFLPGIPPAPVLSDSGTVMTESPTDSCLIQMTYIGTRFSLKNSVPVKGLQAVIYMKNPINVDTADVIFDRAKMMTTTVNSKGNEVNIVMWNYSNNSIDVGDAPILRLPVQLSSDNIDSMHIVVSTTDSNTVTLLASSQADIRNTIPREWTLYQNYPNPFNPSTTIEFDVPEVYGKIPRVAVQIFNVLGQKVTTIEKGIYQAGRYKVTWNGTSENGTRVSSGVYFYRLLAGDYATTKKMVMIK